MNILEISTTILFSTTVNFLIAIPLIYILYKLRMYKKKVVKKNVKKKRNPKYYKFLEKNMDTPSSFGITIFLNILLLFVILFVLDLPKTTTYTLTLLSFTIIFLALGLADDISEYFFYLKRGVWGIRARYKIAIQLLLAGSALYFVFHPPILLLILGALALTFIINSYNITDGLDGLVGGPSLIILTVFLYFEAATHNNTTVMLFISIFIGFHIVFLYFNVNPARIFLGDAGSLPLGFIIGFLAIRYPLLCIGPLLSILLFEGLSSLLQILSIRIRGRKLFLIAPFHLHLLNKGWSTNTIVFRTWILQIVLAVSSIIIFEMVNTQWIVF